MMALAIILMTTLAGFSIGLATRPLLDGLPVPLFILAELEVDRVVQQLLLNHLLFWTLAGLFTGFVLLLVRQLPRDRLFAAPLLPVVSRPVHDGGSTFTGFVSGVVFGAAAGGCIGFYNRPSSPWPATTLREALLVHSAEPAVRDAAFALQNTIGAYAVAGVVLCGAMGGYFDRQFRAARG